MSNQLLLIYASDPADRIALVDEPQRAQDLLERDFARYAERNFRIMGAMVDASTVDIQNYLIRYWLSIDFT
ncbi:MAG: hypothetical protein AMJ88_07395 [Anaerolineae bacterium SM23_ 63]|nr:MAG: hypothetical protein AMJ88_07395 [Anaerolineae bacterium SM23_ 63]